MTAATAGLTLSAGDAWPLPTVPAWMFLKKKIPIVFSSRAAMNDFNVFIDNLPFENHCFDLIVSNNGVKNIQDITRAFRECRRVVPKG